MPPRSFRRVLLPAAGVSLALAGLVLILGTVLAARSGAEVGAGAESLLQAQARDIRREFATVLEGLQRRREAFRGRPLPDAPASVFALFKSLRLNPTVEGIALLDATAAPGLWLGNVIDLRSHIPGPPEDFLPAQNAALLVRSNVSTYLVLLTRAAPSEFLAFFRLLAFSPQLRSTAVRDYHFLAAEFRRNARLDFWDFQDDVALYEKMFGTADFSPGPAPREGEGPSLFFPLRNEAGRIVATVTLTTPGTAVRLTTARETRFFLAALLVLIALGAAFFHAATSPRLWRERKPLAALGAAALVAAFRLVFIPFSRLAPVRSLDVFSPARAGFLGWGALTKSPADIFLTALAAAGLILVLALLLRALRAPAPRRWRGLPALGAGFAAAAVAFPLLGIFQAFVRRLVLNSNINLLKFELSASFLLLHVALLIALAGVVTLAYLLLRGAAQRSPNPGLPFLALLTAAGLQIALFRGRGPLSSAGLHVALLLILLAAATWPAALKKRSGPALVLLFSVLYMTFSLDLETTWRVRGLVQGLLRTSFLGQEQWAGFLLNESFPEVDKKRRMIVSFFRRPDPPDFARTLWVTTLPAAFNWYSSLEVLAPDGTLLSRFSLNIPTAYGPAAELPASPEWQVTRRPHQFAGKERELLVGWKDWSENGRALGRTVLTLSLDPELLPFLYSANPYFELLRAGSLPSLDQFDLRFALYDVDGRLLFNPQRLTAGLPRDARERARNSPFPFWGTFRDGTRSFAAYYVRDGSRIAVFLVPEKDIRARLVTFLKLLFLDLFFIAAVGGLAVLAFYRRLLRSPFRSFSTRVYAAFLAAAFIPLVFFTFFTRDLFDRVFADRFVEEAAARAGIARSLLEDFLFFQEQEGLTPLTPSEDMVLGISATLGNDVNLYDDGRLAASSRREFFDAGILPDLLDGETFYRLVHERMPFAAERRAIGPTSFRTLTVPSPLREKTLFIALPFPFERQETARAAAELVEFVVFSSVFFIALLALFGRTVRSMIIVPVRKLVAASREVGLGNLEVRVDHRSRDEMMTLIDGFNAMIRDLKKREQELADMSRKVAWAEMARKVAHEIKNPLTPIQLSAEHLLKVYEDRRGDFDRALRESLSYIISEVENLRRIAQDFMELARDTSLRQEVVDLRDIVTATVDPYRRLLAERILFSLDFEAGDFRLRGDAAKLQAALRNILINAVESISRSGEVRVHLRREGDRLIVEVRDTGPGMDAATLDKIFEPYFSTKSSGTGLGLPIARKVIEDHGGSIRLASTPGEGTTVTIELPALA